MICRYPALCIVFILSLFCVAFSAAAQPTLPDISGVADTQGIVMLTWNCQYNGIKSISVLRSNDNINYAAIGGVQHTNKGIQTYMDTKPAGGNNFYKLMIVFSSGLKWGSNYCKVYIKGNGSDGSALKDTVSLPLIASVTDPVKSAIKQTDTPVYAVKSSPVLLPKNNRVDTPSNRPEAHVPKQVPKSSAYTDGTGNMEDVAAYMTSRKKLVFTTYDTSSIDVANLVLSHFIYTDPVSGNINIEMPGDWNRIHYTVSFYNDSGLLLYNIPHISAPSIIMDKRNFQRKGTYKFVIRTAIIEFEEGYVTVAP